MTAAVHAAFSLSEEIKDFGAYAGFAAVLGLAVLSMLYFAQARELKRLRDWAGRAPERAAELEARVQAEASKRVVAEPIQPRPAQAGVAATPAAAATPAGQAAAAAPAAAGGAAAATAAGAATAPAPTPGNGGAAPGAGPGAKPGAPAPATPGAPQPATAGASAQPATPGAPAAQPAGAGQPGVPAPAGTPGAPAAKPAAPAQPGGPAAKPPAPDQPGAPAAAPTGAPSTPAAKPGAPTPAPSPATASASAPTAPRAPLTVDPEHDATDRADSARPYVRPAAPPPAPAQPLRASTPSATLPPRTPAGATAPRRRATESVVGGDSAPSPIRRNLAIVGGVLATAVLAIVLVTGLFGGDEPTEPANQITPNATTEPAGAGSGAATGGSGAGRRPITRGEVTVAVLNGTTTTGLARAAGNRIQSSGYKLGVVTNAADQQRSATIVSYTPGHRAEALDVARIIKVGADAVQPIDQSTQVVAGQEAFVVVTVGADQNT
jgi:hypothetical protein